jgi:hypothetical protein
MIRAAQVRELAKEKFKWGVSKNLTGKKTELWKIRYFTAYKRHLPVIEQALETVGLMAWERQVPG